MAESRLSPAACVVAASGLLPICIETFRAARRSDKYVVALWVVPLARWAAMELIWTVSALDLGSSMASDIC